MALYNLDIGISTGSAVTGSVVLSDHDIPGDLEQALNRIANEGFFQEFPGGGGIFYHPRQIVHIKAEPV